MGNRSKFCKPFRSVPRLAGLAVVALFAFSASRADTLQTTGFNFPLNGGGGGDSAKYTTTGGTVYNLEVYCNDFNNEIYSNYTYSGVTMSSLTSGSDLSKTRFGGVTSWHTLTLTNDTEGEGTYLNSITSALTRYQMAAYLVSLYQWPANNSNANTPDNEIQMAIWELLDPTSYPTPVQTDSSLTADPSVYLDAAADWLHTTTAQQRDSFLSGFRVVSSLSMTSSGAGNPLSGGFQEQITYLPEPGTLGMFAFGFVGLALVARRRHRTSASD